MLTFAESVIRVSLVGGRHNWLMAAAGLVALAPALIWFDRLFSPLAAGPVRTAADVFQVENPGGRRIGTLSIDYPKSLRENEDAPIHVRYTAEERWRAEFAAAAGREPPRLSVHLAAPRLSLDPKPASYTFDTGRILAGGDGRSWIVSPEKEGNYTLLVRLEAEPAGFRAVPVSVGGERLGRLDQVPLPVAVRTRYNLPQYVVDLAKLAASLIAFLLTLPFAASILKRWVGLTEGGVPATPGPAAPKGAARRRRPRDGDPGTR